jgi:hypothetical protein
MSIRITLPGQLSLLDWADQVALDLDPYGSFGRLDNKDAWQEWAMNILNTSTIKGNFPVPYDFDDWRDWAERFCQEAG